MVEAIDKAGLAALNPIGTRQQDQRLVMDWDVLDVAARWGLRKESAEACAVRLVRMLDGLFDVHPGFRELLWSGNGEHVSTKAVCASSSPVEAMARLFTPQKYYDRQRKRRLPDGFMLNAVSKLDHGHFISIFMGVGTDADYPERFWPTNQLSISFNILDDGNSNAAALAALKPTLLGLVSAWEPDCAGVFSTRYRQRSRGPADPNPFSCGSWIVYLPVSIASTISPPSAAILEEIAGSGILMKATEGPFSADDPDQIAVADAIHAVVAPLGF